MTKKSNDVIWVAKKPPVYCRPHGRKIVGFFNGIGMCRLCAGIGDLPLKLVKQALEAAPTLESDLREGKLHSSEEVFGEDNGQESKNVESDKSKR